MSGGAAIPARLGKYEIRGTLGRGAMGVVLDGWDPIIDRRVAIKTLRLPDASDDEALDALDRFKREAQAAGRLTHPNIVGVFEYGQTDELAFIVMEFVEGRSLKDVIATGPMATVTAVRLIQDVLAGLSYSHGRGVVHRDIKPANIMLTKEDQAKIADFGIARIESSSMTQAGTVMGTPAYMPPEQFLGQTVDRRADIYSTGVMLYQLLTGERPFEGSLASIMHKVMNTAPPRPSDVAVTAPPALDAVVAKAMARRPEDRFDTAADFAQALRTPPPLPEPADAGGDATIVTPRAKPLPLPAAAPTSLATAVGASPTLPMSPTPQPPQSPQQARSRLPVLAGAGVAVLAAAGLAAWLLLPTSRLTAPDTATSTPAGTMTVSNAPTPTTPTPTTPTPTTTASVAPTATSGVPASGVTRPAAPLPETASPVTSTRQQPPVQSGVQTPPFSAPAPTPATGPSPTAVSPPSMIPAATPSAPPPVPQPTVTAGLALPLTPSPPAATPPAQQPTPEATPSATPVPAPVPASAVAASLAMRLPGIGCSLLQSGVGSDGRPMLTGLVGTGAPTEAAQRAVDAAAASRSAVSWNLQSFEGPFCPVLDYLRSLPDTGLRLDQDGGRTALADGELIAMRITMPGFAGFLHVAYLQSNQLVSTLVPGPGYPPQTYGARATGMLGTKREDSPGWQVGKPFGTDMIVAIVSTAPLFSKPLPDDQPLGAYLSSLRSAIDTLRRRGGTVAVAAQTVETVETKPTR